MTTKPNIPCSCWLFKIRKCSFFIPVTEGNSKLFFKVADPTATQNLKINVFLILVRFNIFNFAQFYQHKIFENIQ